MQFDSGKMALGLTLLILTLALHVYVLCSYFQDTGVAPAPTTMDEGRQAAKVNRAQTLETMAAFVLMALGSACRLSNSFIMAEGDAAHFFVASFAVIFAVRSLSSMGGFGDAHSGTSATVTGASAAAAAIGLLMCNVCLQGGTVHFSCFTSEPTTRKARLPG